MNSTVPCISMTLYLHGVHVQVVSAATTALSAGSVEHASHLAAGLVLGMQQLVTAITLPPAAEAATGSTITAMAAAQDAVRVAASSAAAGEQTMLNASSIGVLVDGSKVSGSWQMGCA